MSDYDINMMGTSELIQELAQAYGERRIIDCCIEWLSTIEPAHDKKVMQGVFRVFAIDCVKRDLSFYIKVKAIKPQAAANLIATQNTLVKDMAANIDDLVKLLNVPEDILKAPLAGDYEGYFS